MIHTRHEGLVVQLKLITKHASKVHLMLPSHDQDINLPLDSI